MGKMMSFVSRETYGGIDWHDSKTLIRQLQKDNQYAMQSSDVKDVIIDDIAKDFPYLEKTIIANAINNKTKVTFEVLTPKQDDNGNIIYMVGTIEDGIVENEATIDGEKLTVDLRYCWGQVEYNTIYYVEECDIDDVVYIVSENFLAPRKGNSVIERIYHDVFINRDEAEKYFEKLQLHTQWKSEKCITIGKKSGIVETDWYKHNMQAIKLMDELNITPYDDSFDPDVRFHCGNLAKRKYS